VFKPKQAVPVTSSTTTWIMVHYLTQTTIQHQTFPTVDSKNTALT